MELGIESCFHRSSIAVSEGSLRMHRGITKGNIELKIIAVMSLFLGRVSAAASAQRL